MKISTSGQRLVCLLVITAFLFLVHSDLLPSSNAPVREEGTISASSTDGPGSLEKVDDSGKAIKKKRFPWLLVGLGGLVAVGVAMAASVLVKGNRMGEYSDIIILFNINFWGANLKVPYKVYVDDQLMVDDTLVFNAHYTPGSPHFTQVSRSFEFKRVGAGAMKVRVECPTHCDKVWAEEESGLVYPDFTLWMLSYQYTGGKDPGRPELDKYSFSVHHEPLASNPAMERGEVVVMIHVPSNRPAAARVMEAERTVHSER